VFIFQKIIEEVEVEEAYGVCKNQRMHPCRFVVEILHGFLRY
jgi:hypothetical protein